ncbi:MAG: DUF2177 family protein [Xanthobacteraceae bacterium]
MIQVVGYLAALATFVVADMVWLGLMTPRFYRPTLGDILITGVNLPPALVFYLVYPVGLVIFAVNPALKSGSVGSALLNGALFGFFTYATYDLSNYATLRNWSLPLTVVDIAWGSVLAALAAAVSFWLVTRLVGAG